MHDPHTPRGVLRLLLAGGLFLFVSTVAGCGLLGGGDESEDENFPDPPGRPNSSVQVIEAQPTHLVVGTAQRITLQ